MLTAIITGLVVVVANLALVLLLTRGYNKAKASLLSGLRLYFEAHGEQPSEFSKFLDIVVDRASAKMAQSLKMVFYGTQSGEAKNVKRLEGALVQDLMEAQSPMLSTIAQSFPAVGKLIRKNPNLIPLLQGFLGKKGDGSTSPSEGEVDYGAELSKY